MASPTTASHFWSGVEQDERIPKMHHCTSKIFSYVCPCWMIWRIFELVVCPENLWYFRPLSTGRLVCFLSSFPFPLPWGRQQFLTVNFPLWIGVSFLLWPWHSWLSFASPSTWTTLSKDRVVAERANLRGTTQLLSLEFAPTCFHGHMLKAKYMVWKVLLKSPCRCSHQEIIRFGVARSLRNWFLHGPPCRMPCQGKSSAMRNSFCKKSARKVDRKVARRRIKWRSVAKINLWPHGSLDDITWESFFVCSRILYFWLIITGIVAHKCLEGNLAGS